MNLQIHATAVVKAWQQWRWQWQGKNSGNEIDCTLTTHIFVSQLRRLGPRLGKVHCGDFGPFTFRGVIGAVDLEPTIVAATEVGAIVVDHRCRIVAPDSRQCLPRACWRSTVVEETRIAASASAVANVKQKVAPVWGTQRARVVRPGR